MISSHQPTIFPNARVRVAVSSIDDGSMKWGTAPEEEVRAHRTQLLTQLAMPVAAVAVPQVLYGGDDYCRYHQAEPGITTIADALVTSQNNLPIFLPLADCTGAVLYDPRGHALMVSHLGRHSTEQDGAVRSVQYLCEQTGARPKDLLVWCSPSPGSETYPLWAYDNRSFRDVLSQQFSQAGIAPDHLQFSQVDTALSPHYYSHSQFLKGQQDIDGRYAVVAMLV